eukprot:CAMPEP_0178938608 /NCGR_PEP_ID=MMETSP0786-20121207/26426_1 /TAXON_ID=186022 /ORGANISM="Thalassionema frauenfeldii, Strain CCMP 1798" /LENGTH=625 /DNA_ID=CAMNT_0020617347 /DNA_START=225 /DNA_END=2102 /DNA_ORIENTATION=-
MISVKKAMTSIYARLPPPQFLTSDRNSNPFLSKSPASKSEETDRRIEEQQKQIDMLLKAVNARIPNLQQETGMELTELAQNIPSQSLNSGDKTLSSVSVAPLRVMVFIDGTWLYYSIHERQAHICPIIAKLGRGWQKNYNFNWNELPRIICDVLQEQESKNGWLNSDSRPVEISRVNVFTSVKKNTPKHSTRLRMFDEMNEANYDVYMMETVGQGEKCIDIQLAVEMLHYATVPNAYDVAILLSGDKDFMPALIRTRQKARKVGIVSMKTYCNRALYETNNVADYDVIWLEDHLDRLFIPVKNVMKKKSQVSLFTLMKVIYDFIDKSGLPMVSSRDVGRYLKQFKLGDTDLQTEIKYNYRSLRLFIGEANIFSITLRSADSNRIREKADPKDKSFWIGLTSNAESFLLAEAKTTNFSEIEKRFFDRYSLALLDNRETAYQWSILQLSDVQTHVSRPSNGNDKLTPLQSVQNEYSTLKVIDLKELCRQRCLPVSGTKSVLIARLEENDKDSMMIATKNVLDDFQPKLEHQNQANDPTTHHLLNIVNEYIQASGGTASSRDIGRYLTANASYAARENGGNGVTALTELKEIYGSLNKFVNSFPQIFDRSKAIQGDDGGWEFMVSKNK